MKKIFFLTLVILFAIFSCKKNFPIPKQPADISPSLILTTALSGTASNVATNYIGLTRWMGYWARSGTFSPDNATETYDIKNDYTDNEWSRLYGNLRLYDYMETFARSGDDPFYIGVAKVMKAYDFATLVDLYNDVPYKEAFNAATESQPAYDNAQDIYNDLGVQLDSAFSYFENARKFYKQASSDVINADYLNDIMFGYAGSKTSGYAERLTLWEKLTNTLELKLLMHQSQVSAQQGYIKQELSIVTTSQARKAAGFLGPGENAAVNPGYGSSNVNSNPFYALFHVAPGGGNTTNYNYYLKNRYAGNFYGTTNDPRSLLTYDPTLEKNFAQLFSPYSDCLSYFSDTGASVIYTSFICLNFLNSRTAIFSYDSMGSFYQPFIWNPIGGGYNIAEGSDPGYSSKFSDTLPLYKLDAIYDGNNNDYFFYGDPVNYGDPDSLVASSYLSLGIRYFGTMSVYLINPPAPVYNHRIGIASNVGPGLLKGVDQDQLILSDFESLFLQAEAVQRGYINGNAQALYESAIIQNFAYLYKGNQGDAAGDARKYISQDIPDAGWIASPNKIEAIMTQKWIAMNGINWVESYTDYRRTGYPTPNVLGISKAPAHVRPMIPTRFLYPESELKNNGGHVPVLPDAQYSKVFWNQ
jgi:SusD/RagB-like outer membrane lipoprotein